MFERLEEILVRCRDLESQLADPKVIGDAARYKQVAKEYGSVVKLARKYDEYKRVTGDLEVAQTLLDEGADAETKSYADAELQDLRGKRQKLQTDLEDMLLDSAAAQYASLIMEIRAGTGGEEAALFARDLYGMYTHYAVKRGWKTEVMSASASDLGGFREIAFSVSGEGAFRELQFESGGHRVQRVPVTEAQGRIHTSAATVAVLPEPDEVEIVIRDEDLQIDTMRSGGPGGQHQNKTESGVRITHLPSGLVVNCRDEKSQHKNKAKAMRVLRSRLYDMVEQKARSQRDAQRRTLIGSGDRSERIRTYNFPQNRVTDHRINVTLYNLDTIIAGDADELVKALLDYDRKQQLALAAPAAAAR